MVQDLKKIQELKEKLAKYRPIYEEKRRVFRGVKHEDSLSELRYTQFMVYKNLVEGLEKELRDLPAGRQVTELNSPIGVNSNFFGHPSRDRKSGDKA